MGLNKGFFIKFKKLSFILIIFTIGSLSGCGPKPLSGYLESIGASNPILIFKEYFDGAENALLSENEDWADVYIDYEGHSIVPGQILFDGAGRAKLQSDPNGFGGAMYVGTAASAGGYVQAIFQYGFSSNGTASLMLRSTPGTLVSYACMLADNEGSLFIALGPLGAGVDPAIPEVNTGILSTTTDPITIGCEITDEGVLNGYVNGSLVATYILGTAVEDSPMLNAGLVSVIISSPETRILDFKYYNKKPN